MSKLNLESGLLEDVVLFYTKIQKPSLKYQSQTEREFSVSCLVDKKTRTDWNKAFPKQRCKEVEYDEFCEKFGAEYAIGDDEQYLVTLKKPATYKDKTTGQITEINEKYRPRVFMNDGSGQLEDITFEKLVGNGSVGVVQFDVNTNDFGTFAKLGAIRVDSLVAVEHKGGTNYDVLGTVKTLAEIPTAAKKEPESTQNVDEDENLPF